MKKFRPLVIASSALLALLTLAGCAPSTQNSVPPAPAGADYNDADAQSVTMLTARYEQTVDIAETVIVAEGADQATIDLAKQVKDNRTAQLDKLRAWLAQRNINSTGLKDNLLQDDKLKAYKSSTESAATSLFMDMLVDLDKDTLTAAQKASVSGKNPEAIEFAKNAVTEQTVEVAKTQAMLDALLASK